MREGWGIRPLAEVCEIKPPKHEVRSRLADDAPVSFVSMNDLGIREKWLLPKGERPLASVAGSYTYFADGDVLLAKITPCFENGKLGIARGLTNGVGFGSSEFVVLRPSEALDAEFLFYFLSQDSFRDAGARVMSGAVGHKRVPKEFIQGAEIPIPPLPEQKRIVAILDEAFAGIDAAIANTEKNLANARELFESYLNAVFSQRKEGWCHAKLGREIDLQTGFAFKSKGYTTDVDGVRLLRGDNIVPGGIRWRAHKKWPRDDTKPYKRYELVEDDIVLAMDRTWVKGGLKYGQIKSADLPCLLVQRVARLRAGSRLNSEFLRFLIGSRGFTEYILSIQTGLGVPHVSGSQISEFEFFLPSVDEQAEIAGTLEGMSSSVGRLESIYEAKHAALCELKQSLLQKAFSGDLTAVPQDEIEDALA